MISDVRYDIVIGILLFIYQIIDQIVIYGSSCIDSTFPERIPLKCN